MGIRNAQRLFTLKSLDISVNLFSRCLSFSQCMCAYNAVGSIMKSRVKALYCKTETHLQLQMLTLCPQRVTNI